MHCQQGYHITLLFFHSEGGQQVNMERVHWNFFERTYIVFDITKSRVAKSHLSLFFANTMESYCFQSEKLESLYRTYQFELNRDIVYGRWGTLSTCSFFVLCMELFVYIQEFSAFWTYSSPESFIRMMTLSPMVLIYLQTVQQSAAALLCTVHCWSCSLSREA